MGDLNVAAPDAPIEAMRASILEHGYLVVEKLAADLAARALADVGPHVEAAPFGHDDFLGRRTKRVGGLLRKSPAARDLAIHPVAMALCEAILLPYAAAFQLNFSGVMHLEPGAEAQVLHRDGLLYPVRHPCPPMVMPAMWALTDFTGENGATAVAPGSHLWEHERIPAPDEVVPVAMPAGSMLVYTGGLYHGGGANRSNAARTGAALQYSLGWLRQEENQYLANPPEVARTYPERLRRLIGYDYGGPFLGFHEGDDPHRVFESDYDGDAMRSRPEIDERYAAIEPQRFGAVEPVPTPRREGVGARGIVGASKT